MANDSRTVSRTFQEEIAREAFRLANEKHIEIKDVKDWGSSLMQFTMIFGSITMVITADTDFRRDKDLDTYWVNPDYERSKFSFDFKNRLFKLSGNGMDQTIEMTQNESDRLKAEFVKHVDPWFNRAIIARLRATVKYEG
jgi:hypothetical protein